MQTSSNDGSITMGERTKLALNAPNRASLRTTVPMFIVKQWGLKQGQQLYWTFETCHDVSGSGKNELVVIVRRAKAEKREKRQGWSE
jgi:hypothetical protein